MKLKNLWLGIFILVLATTAACGQKNAETAKGNEAATQMSALDAVMTRHSIRQFTNQAISADTTELLLRAGMAAPSAVDKRPWAFVTITDRAVKDTIAAHIGSAAPAQRAPLVILVCGDLTKLVNETDQLYWLEDTSAAMENMLIAAHGMGLGAVWLGVYPRKDRVAFISELMNLPSHIVPMGMMAVGYPAEEGTIKDKWDTSLVHQEKW